METHNNLNTLKILFLIKGVFTFLFSLIFIFYGILGTFFASAPQLNSEVNNIPFGISSIFIIIGVIGFLLTVALGIATIMCSKYIGERSHHTFILVVAILSCFTGILGILLGVFTMIEISKPEVKALFPTEV